MVLRNKSRNPIDMEVSETGDLAWRFTGIYGEPQENMKYKTWCLMEDLMLQQQSGQPWFCDGNFNEVL